MFVLSKEGKEKVHSELKRYETKESAIIPALYVAQKENQGFVSEAVIEHLSQLMDIPASRIQEVAHFYTLFNKKPVGRHHIQICCNISCALNEGREIVSYLCKELKLELEEVSEDGKFSISKVECLGACGKAPMMQVNEKYYEGLTPESAMNIIRGLK